MNKVQILAHRGQFLPEGPIPEVFSNYEIPENTLDAFEQAFEKGFGVETDVRMLKDGNFVIIHDPNLLRLFGENVNLKDLEIPQIKKYSFKNKPNFKIPTLDEICQLAKKYAKSKSFIAFQIKRNNSDEGVKIGSAIAKKMQEYNLQNCIIFDATFKEAGILHDEFPWLNLSLSVGEQNYTPTIYTLAEASTSEFSNIYSSIWADEWKIPGAVYNEKTLKQLRTIYPGRIDIISPELHYNEGHPLSKNLDEIKKLWNELISSGIINGICTDYPSVLKNL